MGINNAQIANSSVLPLIYGFLGANPNSWMLGQQGKIRPEVSWSAVLTN
jgi:hypothetical protein